MSLKNRFVFVKVVSVLTLSLGILLLASGCAASVQNKIVSSSSPKPPDWVLVPPAPDASYHYFVGIGSGPDLARAREAALASAMVEVLRYMGVKVEYEYEKEKLRKGGEVSARIKSYVKAAAQGKVEGMEIQDAYYEKWLSKDGQGKPVITYTYYVLIRYSNEALEREKRRIREKIELEKKKVYALLKDAQERHAKGDYWKALLSYSSAIAFSRKIEEGAEIESRALDGMKDILSAMKLKALDEIVIKGTESRPFRVALYCGSSPVPSAPLRFRVIRGTGKVREVVFTDTRGIAANSVEDFSSPLEGLTVRVKLDDSQIKDQLANATDVYEIIRGYTAGLYIDLEWKGALKAQRLAVLILVRNDTSLKRAHDLEASIASLWKKKGYDVVYLQGVRGQALLNGDYSFLKKKRIRLLNLVELDFEPLGEIYGVYTGRIEGSVKLIDTYTASVLWSASVGPEKGAGISYQQAMEACLERIKDNLASAVENSLR